MKIDAFTKTITLESAIDLVPAQNYLNRYLKNEVKSWKIKDGSKTGVLGRFKVKVEEESSKSV